MTKRSIFEQYHDILMTLYELGPSITQRVYERCVINHTNALKKLFLMGETLNHIESDNKKRTTFKVTYRLTDWGIDAINTWIGIQRLGMKELVTSKFDIDSEPFDKMGIGLKKPYFLGKKTLEIYNFSREKPGRYRFFIALDTLRVLRKHYPKSIAQNKLRTQANDPTSEDFKELSDYMSKKELFSVSEDISGYTKSYTANSKGNTVVNAIDAYAEEHGLESIMPTHVRPRNWKGNYPRPNQYRFLKSLYQKRKKIK